MPMPAALSWSQVALALAVLVVLVAAPRRASAQSVTVQAQSLFDEGRALLKAGKTAEACTAFEASQKLDPAVTTLLNLAACREKNRQLASAWGAFLEANRLARASGDDKLARVATTHAESLKPLLSQLTIAVAADRQLPGLQILRGTEPVNPATWNHALPVDAGTYTIRAKAPGRRPWSTTITIKAEADVQTVELPRLLAATSGTASGTVPPPAGATAAQHSAPTDATSPAVTADADDAPSPRLPSKAVPIALGAGAVALGAAAIAFKISADNAYDRAKTASTQPTQASEFEATQRSRFLAIGLGVAAAECAGAAIYLYLYVRHRREARRASTALTPLASPHLAGLAVTGSW